MKYGAIDIGSNAVRLYIGYVADQSDAGHFIKRESLVRVPIRLGQDVFTEKCVSPGNIKRLTKAAKAFKLLMEAYGVDEFRACATSAMREAENGKAIVQEIKEKTGIEIEIIHGSEEADLILNTFFASSGFGEDACLYIDVGGGSTEVSYLKNGKKVASKSFKLGTVRWLKGKVKEDVWERMRAWVKELDLHEEHITAVGTGGNINKLLKLCGGNKFEKQLSRSELEQKINDLGALSFEERMTQYQLKADRADVIVPAGKIYLSIMEEAGAEQIFIPKLGLSDGIVYDMYKKSKQTT